MRDKERAVTTAIALVSICWGAVCCRASEFRVTAYYPGYEQNSMPASEIDFSVVTHLIHFSAVPRSDGTLDLAANGLSRTHSADVVAHAQRAGREALVCVGGAGSESGFQGATSSANLPVFVSNIVALVSMYPYNGVDIDWEPLPSADFNQYTNLMHALRSALQQLPQPKLLTVAAAPYPPFPDLSNDQYLMFASIQADLDQINLMTYDLSGPYPGWVTWFNSPIFDGGATFPNSARQLPSIDAAVRSFLSNGVAASKLGLGTPFYGVVWSGGAGTSTGGVTQPRQGWTTAPVTTSATFSMIQASYYQSNQYRWDPVAQAAYLSVSNSAPSNDQFISFDDEHATEAKVSYARNVGLGGIMIWELSQDYEPGAKLRHPLLRSIQAALATPGPAGIQVSNGQIKISFSTAPLAAYRVLSATNLAPADWVTLMNNVTGNSNGLAPFTVIDPSGPLEQPSRFYRVQTPP